MAALASSAITVTPLGRQSIGNRFRAEFTVTLTGDAASTWTTTGLAMPTDWKRAIGLRNKVDAVSQMTPMVVSGASPDLSYTGMIDVANDRLFLFGGASGTAEDKPFEALPNAFVPAAAAYSGRFMATGF